MTSTKHPRLTRRGLAWGTPVLLVCLAVASPGAATHLQASLVSRSSSGVPGDAESFRPAISSDGRFVAFESYASNLVAGDTNGWVEDVFVHDRQTGATSLVSVSSTGVAGDGDSFGAAISAGGRFVAFTSWASNLVAGTNRAGDVFVHDRRTGATSLVSVSSTGVAGDGDSFGAAISAGGRFVAFTSWASNLVAGDTNGASDVFVHDRQTGATSLVSVSSTGVAGGGGSFAAAISAGGRFVAFISWASNLVAGDTNELEDVFVHDRKTGKTSRVSVSSTGDQANEEGEWSFRPAISGDGRFVVFSSFASNLVAEDTNGFFDVFVHDRSTGTTSRVSVSSTGAQAVSKRDEFDEGESPPEGSHSAVISSDGRYVAFSSDASNLALEGTGLGGTVFVGERRVYVHDRQLGVTSLVSVDPDGRPGGAHGDAPAISALGRVVAFESESRGHVYARVRGTACDSGAYEDGPVSSSLHDLEAPAGAGGPAMHEESCALADEGL